MFLRFNKLELIHLFTTADSTSAPHGREERGRGEKRGKRRRCWRRRRGGRTGRRGGEEEVVLVEEEEKREEVAEQEEEVKKKLGDEEGWGVSALKEKEE